MYKIINRKTMAPFVIVLTLVGLYFPLNVWAQATDMPKAEKLLNGLKLIMLPDKTADKVYISLRVHSGAAFDPQGKEGLMQMLAANMFPNESAADFFTEDLGGSLV